MIIQGYEIQNRILLHLVSYFFMQYNTKLYLHRCISHYQKYRIILYKSNVQIKFHTMRIFCAE